MDVWELPGPRDFTRKATDRVSRGCNLLLAAPAFGGPDFRRALRTALSADWHWHEISGSTGRQPLELVAEVVGISQNSAPLTVAELARNELLVGSAVWIDGLSVEEWPRWRSFLTGFADAVRAQPETLRGVLMVCVRGEPLDRLPVEDVALSVLRWDDVLGELDVLLYVLAMMSRQVGPPTRTRLLASCIASVARWDLELADRLVNEEPRFALAPGPVLDELGRDRGWNATTEQTWAAGTCGTIDGRLEVHSAIASVRGEDMLIERRLWSSQAGVLLPILEERRQDLLPELRRYLRLPLVGSSGPVHDIQDLELGAIAFHLRGTAASAALKHRVQRLRDIRNRLAHLEALPIELALHQDLFS
jgi:hypothetical protein